MKEKRTFRNCKLLSTTPIDNKIRGLVDVKLNFVKGTVKLKTETLTIKFNNLAEAHMYGNQLIVEFADASNIVLEPNQAPTENNAEDPTKDEAVERAKEAEEDRKEAIERSREAEERTKDETFETKERTETRAFMGLKLDPTMKKILDGYSDKSDKIMEKLDEYLEIYDNASNASVMLAARRARFYEMLSMILGDFAKISPEFFKLLSKEIDEEFKRRDNDALQKELKDQTKALEKEISKLEEEKKMISDKTKALEKEISKLEEEISKLEEEKKMISDKTKALRKREQEILHEEGITTVEDIKKEDDK